MQVTDVLKTLVQVGGQLHDVIAMVEGMVPPGTKGADKLAMVQAILEKSLTVAGVAQPVFEAVWTMLTPLITMLVAKLNATGVFKHG